MTTEMGNTLCLLQEMITNQSDLPMDVHGLLLVVTETGTVKECRYEKLSDIAAIVDAIETQEHNLED